MYGFIGSALLIGVIAIQIIKRKHAKDIDGNTIQISKYDRFLFLVEIPIYNEQGSYSILFTYYQVKQLIENIYRGFDPYNIQGLKFEYYVKENATK